MSTIIEPKKSRRVAATTAIRGRATEKDLVLLVKARSPTIVASKGMLKLKTQKEGNNDSRFCSYVVL